MYLLDFGYYNFKKVFCLPVVFPFNTHLIGKHGVCLDELLGVSVGESLEDVAAHSGPGPAGD